MPLRKQRIKLAGEAIKNAIGCYFVALLMASMMLDGGLMFRDFLVLVGVHCALSFFILASRFNRMTRTDYLVVSLGLYSGSASAPSFWFTRKRAKTDSR